MAEEPARQRCQRHRHQRRRRRHQSQLRVPVELRQPGFERLVLVADLSRPERLVGGRDAGSARHRRGAAAQDRTLVSHLQRPAAPPVGLHDHGPARLERVLRVGGRHVARERLPDRTGHPRALRGERRVQRLGLRRRDAQAARLHMDARGGRPIRRFLAGAVAHRAARRGEPPHRLVCGLDRRPLRARRARRRAGGAAHRRLEPLRHGARAQQGGERERRPRTQRHHVLALRRRIGLPRRGHLPDARAAHQRRCARGRRLPGRGGRHGHGGPPAPLPRGFHRPGRLLLARHGGAGVRRADGGGGR